MSVTCDIPGQPSFCGNITLDAALSNCTSVTIVATTDTQVNGTCLTSVIGTVYIDNGSGGAPGKLVTVQFPQLTFAGGNFELWGSPSDDNGIAVLTYVDIHSLAYVGGEFGIYYSSALTSLTLTALAYVGQNVFIVQNPALVSLSLPALTSVGYALTVQSNSVVTSLGLPVLNTVGWNFYAGENALLSSVLAPELFKIECFNNACNGFPSAVCLCGNTDNVLYSDAILSAASGQACHVPPNHCGTATTCK